MRKTAEQRAQQKHDFRAANYNKHLWNAAKRRAAKHGVKFTIEPRDVVVPDRCPVLGITLGMQRHRKGKANHNGGSIDRIRPELGYTPGNIIVVSNRVNILKSDATIVELIAIADFYRRFL